MNPKNLKPFAPGERRVGRAKGVKNKLTAADVEYQYGCLIRFDPIRLFEKTGKGKTQRFRLRDIDRMDPETRACIASVKVRTENLTAGDGLQDQTVEIRLWNKVQALEVVAKHFKWIEDKVSLEITEDVLARLDAWKLKQRAKAPKE